VCYQKLARGGFGIAGTSARGDQIRNCMVAMQVQGSHRKEAPRTILHITNLLHRMAPEFASAMTLRQRHIVGDGRGNPVA